MTTAGIVGLGLVGGSLARDLADAGWRVLGADRDQGAVDAARAAGILDPLDLDTPDDFHHLDLLVLAVPIRAALEWIRRLAPRIPRDSDLVVTDVCSTKESLSHTATAVGLAPWFVGSHPMAGDHRSGWAASRTGLFRDATVWLCPGPDSGPRAIDRVAALWRTVGGLPRALDPAEHDRRLAHTSHLPQVVSTTLATALDRAGFRPDDLGPGGRDVSRLAASDPDMWLDILLDNAHHVGPAVERLADRLLEIAAAMRDAREDALRQALSEGRAWSASPRPEPNPS